MAKDTLRKKYGAVILLDALGAATYSEQKIRNFLSTRADINSLIKQFPKQASGIGNFHTPEIFTFGDTVIITIQLRSKKFICQHLILISILMRRYLFHSMEHGILFRGAFSIGSYIADSASNTVMGDAVADAASWYEMAEWAGLFSTPKAKIVIEYHATNQSKFNLNASYLLLHEYNIPLKQGRTMPLLSVAWPSAFFEDFLLDEGVDGVKYFYEILSGLPMPKGTELKYQNTIDYFRFIEKHRSNLPTEE